MAKIEQWQYGDSGEVVKNVIDSNFVNINEQLNQFIARWEFHFKPSDWADGTINIAYSKYKKVNPCVDLYIKDNDGFSVVYGGCKVYSDYIELQSDIPYEGKVVVR